MGTISSIFPPQVSGIVLTPAFKPRADCPSAATLDYGGLQIKQKNLVPPRTSLSNCASIRDRDISTQSGTELHTSRKRFPHCSSLRLDGISLPPRPGFGSGLRWDQDLKMATTNRMKTEDITIY